MLRPMRSIPLPVLALAFAAVVLGLAAMLRDPEYDEGYTVFVTSAAARPNWPDVAFRVADARAAFRPAPTPWSIDGNLRRTDVHPPLYFWTVWAWRRLWGPDLAATRMLSVGFSLGALACVAAIATEAGFPALTSLLLTLGCYGFVETGIVARGFAMAQCLLLLGLLLALRAARATGTTGAPGAWSLAAGLALGTACFTNYLAAFPAAAAALWFGWQRPRQLSALLLGLVPFILADLSFFLDQRNSRIGQFPPFAWRAMGIAIGPFARRRHLGRPCHSTCRTERRGWARGGAARPCPDRPSPVAGHTLEASWAGGAAPAAGDDRARHAGWPHPDGCLRPHGSGGDPLFCLRPATARAAARREPRQPAVPLAAWHSRLHTGRAGRRHHRADDQIGDDATGRFGRPSSL